MKFIEDLRKYIPYNAQEAKDKKYMLDYFKKCDDFLFRSSFNHVSASSWIVNEDFSKILLIYHNIYNSWSWTGGHADGCGDLLYVAIKEAKEETGLVDIKVLSEDIFSIESLCVNGHIKNGEYISSHIHLNFTYLLQANSNDPLFIKEDENSGVRWFDMNRVITASNEEWMNEHIYKKLNEKLLMFQNKKNTSEF